jgi:hypothetical protein
LQSFGPEIVKERNHFEDRSKWEDNIQTHLTEIGCISGFYSNGLGCGPVGSTFKHGNKLSNFKKTAGILIYKATTAFFQILAFLRTLPLAAGGYGINNATRQPWHTVRYERTRYLVTYCRCIRRVYGGFQGLSR